jgi:hypothetical protein
VATICQSIYDTLTPEWLKATFLFGVDLTDDENEPYPDVMFEQAIKAAVDLMEKDLGIVIDPWEVKNERHDMSLAKWDEVWPVRLDRRPVRQLDSWQVRFGNLDPVEMPTDWLVPIAPDYGQYHVMASSGNVTTSQLWNGFPLLPSLFNNPSYVPGYLVANYTAGFDVRCGTIELPEGETEVQVDLDPEINDRYDVQLSFITESGAAGLTARNISRDGFLIRASTPPAGGSATIRWVTDTVPALMKQAIGHVAAALPLDIAGDLIAGAGIANFSTSVDGVSQSVGTTSSATNSGYGARVQSFAKQMKAEMRSLRSEWRLPGVGAV